MGDKPEDMIALFSGTDDGLDEEDRKQYLASLGNLAHRHPIKEELWDRMEDRPYLATAISVRVAQGVYSGAARKVMWMPRPPGGFACGGSHCVARSRLGNPAPVRPGGAPQGHGCRLASVDFSKAHAPGQKVGAGRTAIGRVSTDGLAVFVAMLARC